MSTINLLEETDKILEENLARVNVMWVGNKSGRHSMTWEEFRAVAADINYDAGYGSQEIPMSLVVAGADWWLERHEYDGSEWWEFKRVPVRLIESEPYDLKRAFDCQRRYKDYPEEDRSW